jgi:hypothetical protein
MDVDSLSFSRSGEDIAQFPYGFESCREDLLIIRKNDIGTEGLDVRRRAQIA